MYINETDVFLLGARKRPKNVTANYMISLDHDCFDKESKYIVGKIRSNFLGTIFNIFDSGKNPKNTNIIDEIRNQLGVVTYVIVTLIKEPHLFGFSGPKRMKVYLPEVENGKTLVYKASKDEEDNIHWKFKKCGDKKIKKYVNKAPEWSESIRI